MFTSTESRPLVGKVFRAIGLALGGLGTCATVAILADLVWVGPGSQAAGVAAIFGAGSLGVILLGVPCTVYSLYCDRTKLGWIALALCFVPFAASFAISAMVGGGR